MFRTLPPGQKHTREPGEGVRTSRQARAAEREAERQARAADCEAERQAKAAERERQKQKDAVARVATSILGSAGRTAANQIVHGLFGTRR